MASETSLPVNWEKKLRNAGGVTPLLQVIVDPNDQALTFGSGHDINKIGSIDFGFEPDLDRIFDINVYDLAIGFNDKDEFFNPGCTRTGWRPFRRILRVLDGAPSSNVVALRDGLMNFQEGDVVIFTNGTDREIVSVTAADSSSLTYAGSLNGSYSAGDVVSTIPVTGMDVLVRMKLLSESQTLDLFEGVVRQAFDWRGVSSDLKLDNKLSKALDQELRIHASSDSPSQRVDTSGSLASSLSWSDGSSGTCSGVTIYTGARLGEWKVTFSDNTNFTVDGPNCKGKAGTTGANFFDQTDATDSQIQIPSANWGGTRADGDILTFYVCANFDSKRLAEIIYELLYNYANIDDLDVSPNGVSGVGSTDLVYSFNETYKEVTDTFTLSFDSSVTIGQAVASVLPHGIAALTHSVTNNLRLVALHSDFRMATVTPEMIGEPELLSGDLANEITVKYGWDYGNNKAQYEYTYPERDADNTSFKLHGKKISKVFVVPGIYSDSVAESLSKRIYSVFKNGLFLFRSVCSLKNLMADIGDVMDVSLGNPGVTFSDTLIYRVSKKLGETNRVEIYSLACGGLQDNEDEVFS